ncbi:MAG: hypothetical protein PVS3B3_32380 [Ktedonobacteraceae bacterium]
MCNAFFCDVYHMELRGAWRGGSWYPGIHDSEELVKIAEKALADELEEYEDE